MMAPNACPPIMLILAFLMFFVMLTVDRVKIITEFLIQCNDGAKRLSSYND